MARFFLKRILFPIILWFLVVALSAALLPAELAALKWLPALIYTVVLLYWWLTGLAHWLVRRWRWVTVGYLLTNLAIALLLSGAFFAGGIALDLLNKTMAALVGFLSLLVGPGWFLWSIVHLLRYGQRRRKSVLWRLMADWLEQTIEDREAKPPQPARPARSGQSPRPPTSAPPAPTRPAARKANQPLFTPVGPGEGKPGRTGVAIPPRPSTPAATQDRKVSNDATEFVRQGQEWALRQEYVGNYVPFEAYYPTYRQMSFEQQQWYFYWRTQLRQGKFLATDLSYLFVYVYELLNRVGVTSPVEARDRLVTFWNAYRSLQPKLDNYMVDWVADFSLLNNLSQSTLDWYAQALRAGATNRNSEVLEWEAWHQHGRDYSALPAPTLYALAGYATQQNKFYQSYQNELALDEALKRGVAVIDDYVQKTQQLSLYELHLPMPTQTVMRPPLLGALHCYPTTPIVIGRVRPWLTETTLKEDLRSILRYTENILRTQATFKTKLRGVTLPPAWAALLDQAFVKAPPKRVVNIDLAGAAALQRESDELRRRLLAGEEMEAQAANANEAAPRVPTPQPAPVVENTAPASPTLPQIQRPADAPDGLLTDLSALIAIMGDANSEATQLLRALRAQQWQGKPTTLPLTGANQFVSVLFDRINERALAQLGDALLFMEEDEWVVAEDYRDEIAYLLDHPDFAGKAVASQVVPVAAGSASSNVVMPTEAPAAGEQADLIPSGWEECVRQMSPLGWATLAIVLAGSSTGQDEVIAKLEALARSHFVTANQLLDQTNEAGLNTMGDNLIDVATTPPQVIEEYRDALTTLVQWAQAHDQIEGLL